MAELSRLYRYGPKTPEIPDRPLDRTFPGLIPHLAGCRSCQRLAGRLERIDRHFRNLPIPKPRPGLLTEILRATLSVRPKEVDQEAAEKLD
jgi:hypothetical protein